MLKRETKLKITIMFILLIFSIISPSTAAVASNRFNISKSGNNSSQEQTWTESKVLIDDFETPSSIDSWQLSTFGTATSSMSLSEGINGQGVAINYQIDEFGGVIFKKVLNSPISANALSLYVKLPPRVILTTNFNPHGHYNVRPFYARDEGDWYRVLVPFSESTLVNEIEIKIRLPDSMRWRIQAQGIAYIDEVELIQSPIEYEISKAGVSVKPFVNSPPHFNKLFGVDYNQREGADTTGLNILQQLNNDIVRTDVMRWHAFENSPGVYNFPVADSVIYAHRSKGFKTLVNIKSGNVFYTGNWNIAPTTAQELEAFGIYVEKIAERYTGLGLYYDIWSEPEIPYPWEPVLSGEQFAAIVQKARESIRKHDPTATIVTGGILGYGYSPGFINSFLEHGGFYDIDAFGIHSYNLVQYESVKYIESMGESLLVTKSVFETNNIEYPSIWDTETGYGYNLSDFDAQPTLERRQAQWSIRHLLTGWANGLDKVIYWPFQDVYPDPLGPHIGLIDMEYNDYLVMEAVRYLYSVSERRAMTGWMNNLPANTFGLELDNIEDVVFVLWTISDYPLRVNLSPTAVVTDFLGDPIVATSNGTESYITLTDENSPIYITCVECDQFQHFFDVGMDHWSFNFIESIYEANLTSGFPDGSYQPDNSVTRAEMAVFLLNAMGINPPTMDTSHPFSDISGHWAEAYIEELFDSGLTGGYPDGTYRPLKQVTRAEMAIFLLKARHGNSYTPPEASGGPFSDVEGHWAQDWIIQLEAEGITAGYPDGTFRPDRTVTRAEMAVFLVNAFGLPTL